MTDALLTRHLEPTDKAARAFFSRPPPGPIVMPRLLPLVEAFPIARDAPTPPRHA